jgi:hypothetical protein
LNGNAAAALLTFDDAMVYGHDGVSPTQAEVILLTRNVKLYGTSATLQAYIDIKATAIVDCDWAEDYWLGSATANKRGINIATTTGTCSFMYCSRHTSPVASSQGWNMSGASGTGLTIQYCVSYNVANSHLLKSSTSSGYATFDNIISMLTVDNTGIIFDFTDTTCVLSNIKIIGQRGQSGYGFRIQGSNTLGYRFLDNIVIHSCENNCITGASAGIIFISNLTMWRNGAIAINLISGGEWTINNCIAFGNASAHFQSTGAALINGVNWVLNGDSSFPTASGISGTSGKFILKNSSLGVASGIKTAHTQDISLGSNFFVELTLVNVILGSGTPIANQTFLAPTSFISWQRLGTTAGNHGSALKCSTNIIDTTIYNTASPSMRITPTSVASATQKAVSAPDGRGFKVNVANGQTCTPSVYFRASKAAAGDAANYTGNQPRLILKRNDAMGITADVVLDTGTVAIGNWEQLTGTTAAVTDDGCLEFIIDCDYGTANSFINVDDFSATCA